MNYKPVILMVVGMLLAGMISIQGCKKDDEANGTDKFLYDLARDATGNVWYKNSSALLNKSSGSGHSNPLLRTRYNPIAATRLDASYKVKSGSPFPKGSMIVKELCGSSGNLERYAVLYKDPDIAESDANGWVWGYINSDGSVAEPAANKGSACGGCHSQSGNIDYMLMNKFFP